MKVSDLSNLVVSGATAVTLGTFDGLHPGHQELFNRVKKLAREKGLRTLALTFCQPPQNHINGKPKKKLILPLEKRFELIAKRGIDDVIIMGFQDVGSMSPQEFVGRVLSEQLKATEVVVGYDCQFGKNRAGDTETLRTLGETLGFGVTIVEPVTIEGVVVSSTEVRRAIQAGEVERAAKLLGYRPFICGRVVQREGVVSKPESSSIHFVVDDGLVTPDEGVYLVRLDFPEREVLGLMRAGSDAHSRIGGQCFEINLLDSMPEKLEEAALEVQLMRRLGCEEGGLPACSLSRTATDTRLVRAATESW
jgi:riboflavin kinase / FMN adenylyltransferase